MNFRLNSASKVFLKTDMNKLGKIVTHICRSACAWIVVGALTGAQLSGAQEAVLSPQQQVEQATKAFFQSVNHRDTPSTEPYVQSARDYFSGYPKDNPGGTIRNVRVLKVTLKDANHALISGKLWVMPSNGKAGKTFAFEHGLSKKSNVWATETLLYNYIPTEKPAQK